MPLFWLCVPLLLMGSGKDQRLKPRAMIMGIGFLSFCCSFGPLRLLAFGKDVRRLAVACSIGAAEQAVPRVGVRDFEELHQAAICAASKG